MRIIITLFVISVFMVSLFSCGVIFKKGLDISGTWEGPVFVSVHPGEEDITNVVFKKENGGYTGHITDSFGYLNQTPLKDVMIKDNTVTFTFLIEMEGITINSILTVENNQMTGSFESTDGTVSGTYDLKKVEK